MQRHSTAMLATALLGAALAGCVTTKSTTTTTSTSSAVTGQPNGSSGGINKVAAAQINVQLGLHYLQEGELQVAQEKLQRALTEDPNSGEAHGGMALLDGRLGKVREADREFQRALALDGRAPAMLNSYGVYLCSHGRSEEGVRYLQQAAANALYRTPWVAYTNTGVCLKDLHREAEAMTQFERALQSNPGYSEAVLRASDLDFSQRRYERARLRIDSYLLSYGASPDLLLLGWRIAGAGGDAQDQQRYATRLSKEFPDSAEAHAVSTAASSGT